MVMRRLFITASFLLAFCATLLGQISFTVKHENTASVGESFQLVFELKGEKGADFVGPDLDGLERLFGPAIDENIGDVITSEGSKYIQTTTYTYTLKAKKEGRYNVGAATVSAGGKKLKTKPFTIRVLPADKKSEWGDQIKAEDLYAKLILSRSEAYEQEAILATLKLYASPSVRIREIKALRLPDFEGFIAQEVVSSSVKQYQLERVGNRNMQTVVIQQWMLLPQRAGSFKIPTAAIDFSLAVSRGSQPTGRGNSDDNFFNQKGANYQVVERTVESKEMQVQVKSLPEPKPTDFRDAVGSYTMSLTPPSKTAQTGEPYRLTVTIAGVGNIKLLSAPTMVWPDSFEPYDNEEESTINVTASEISGERKITYLVVPREKGDFQIPPISFSYFDLKSGTYRTLKTKELDIKVEKGANSDLYVSGEDRERVDRLLAEDLRPLLPYKNSPTRLRAAHFAFGLPYILLCVFFALATVAVILFGLRYERQQADVINNRQRRAGRMAAKRLKQAYKLCDGGNPHDFYTELINAVWAYLGDKLYLSTSELSRNNIAEKLDVYGASEELSRDVISFLDEVEYARYAPIATTTRSDLYQQAKKVIIQMENIVKVPL